MTVGNLQTPKQRRLPRPHSLICPHLNLHAAQPTSKGEESCFRPENAIQKGSVTKESRKALCWFPSLRGRCLQPRFLTLIRPRSFPGRGTGAAWNQADGMDTTCMFQHNLYANNYDPTECCCVRICCQNRARTQTLIQTSIYVYVHIYMFIQFVKNAFYVICNYNTNSDNR